MSKRIWMIAGCFYFLVTLGLFVQKHLVAEIHPVEQIIKEDEGLTEQGRATLRAFYSSPPVIPHEVIAKNAKECLECHLEAKTLEDGRDSMATPHPQFQNCLQCHVAGQTKVFDEGSTTWQGLEEPKRGDRWKFLAPPTIPHRLYLRENCLSCHGPQNPDMRLRTTHPERSSCLQCHVPTQAQEF